MPGSHRGPCLAFGLASLLATSACDFFKELEDAESAGAGDSESEGDGTESDGDGTAGTDGDTGDTEGADGPCTVVDERCDDQDVVQSCDPESGELFRVDCGILCGRYLNLTCVARNDGAHGCLCVEPGGNKLDDCGDLETCIASCGDLQGPCADACFGRTTTDSIRIYGALVYCAQDGCLQTCRDTPEICTTCFAQAMAGTAAGCGVERALCDQDRTDDPLDPWDP